MKDVSTKSKLITSHLHICVINLTNSQDSLRISVLKCLIFLDQLVPPPVRVPPQNASWILVCQPQAYHVTENSCSHKGKLSVLTPHLYPHILSGIIRNMPMNTVVSVEGTLIRKSLHYFYYKINVITAGKGDR